MSGGAIVIGGGVGGLAAAIAPERVGIAATIYERAPEIAAVGAGLSLWSNAIKALRRIGVGDAVLAAGSELRASQTR